MESLPSEPAGLVSEGSRHGGGGGGYHGLRIASPSGIGSSNPPQMAPVTPTHSEAPSEMSTSIMSYKGRLAKKRIKTVPENIALLKAQAQTFERKENFRDALEIYWRCLELKREFYGPDTVETCETLLCIADMNNRIAQDLISKNKFREATKFLTTNDGFTAQAFRDPSQDAQRLIMRCHLFNNLTCIRKSQGNIRGALKYTEKSLSIMLQLNMLDHPPTCYLNIGALYSSLGLHAESLKHSYLALQIIKELTNSTKAARTALANMPQLPPGHALTPSKVDMGVTVEELDAKLRNYEPQLAITYFNIAVQQEFLNDFPACLNTYQVAVATATEAGGEKHPLVAKFSKSLRKAQKDFTKRQKDEEALAANALAENPADPNAATAAGATGTTVATTVSAGAGAVARPPPGGMFPPAVARPPPGGMFPPAVAPSLVSPLPPGAAGGGAMISPTYMVSLNSVYAAHIQSTSPPKARGARGAAGPRTGRLESIPTARRNTRHFPNANANPNPRGGGGRRLSQQSSATMNDRNSVVSSSAGPYGNVPLPSNGGGVGYMASMAGGGGGIRSNNVPQPPQSTRLPQYTAGVAPSPSTNAAALPRIFMAV